MPREFEQAGERIADHRAPAMAHVHRPGRVGGDIFDIDADPLAKRRAAIIRARRSDRGDLVAPGVVGEAQVDEARPGDRDLYDAVEFAQFGGDRLGQRARVGLGRLGEHHRGVGRKIAMRRIARRLDRHIPAVEPFGQRARERQIIERGIEMRGETGVEGHDVALTTPRGVSQWWG